MGLLGDVYRSLSPRFYRQPGFLVRFTCLRATAHVAAVLALVTAVSSAILCAQLTRSLMAFSWDAAVDQVRGGENNH